MNKIKALCIILTLVITSCNSVTEFETDKDFLKWLSGKEFTSIGKDKDHYYSDGSMGLPEFPLTIQFDGNKVKYQNCSVTSYDFYRTSDGSYKITFLPDCTKGDVVELVIDVKNEVYTVLSAIYDKSRASHTSGNAIALLDEVVKNEVSYGPSMNITNEDVKISGNRTSTMFDYTKPADNTPLLVVDTAKSLPVEKHDYSAEIKLIKKNFYATTSLLNNDDLVVDTLTSEDDYPYMELVYKNKDGEVLLIKQGDMSNACYDVDEYYFTNNKLYFSYSYHDGAACSSNKPSELRKYIYQDHVVKIIEEKKEMECLTGCDFDLESAPYKTLRKYLSLQGN